MSEPINPYPLNPARYTAEAKRVDARAVALILCGLLRDLPTPDEWAVIESYAMDIASAARKGRSAAVLVQAANKAQAAHIERYTQALDAEIRGQLHPIFANIIKAAGMQ